MGGIGYLFYNTGCPTGKSRRMFHFSSFIFHVAIHWAFFIFQLFSIELKHAK